jgi:hypothetical protein
MKRPAKICASCGRRFEWRRRWTVNWEEVRYCSSACRRRGVTRMDRQIEAAILDLLISDYRSPIPGLWDVPPPDNFSLGPTTSQPVP